MPATVHTTMFKARERAQAGNAANGNFQVTLRVMDDVGNGHRESWLLTWAGDEARAWWAAHGASLEAGQPLQVQATRIRAFTHPRGGAEIHAQVQSLALAPKRYPQAAATAQTA